jgi:hypothetical protein
VIHGARGSSSCRGEINVDPNPAVEGQPVTITVTGPGPWYVTGNPNGDIVEYTPNQNLEIELASPPAGAGASFTVTDFGDPPSDVRCRYPDCEQ